MVQASSPLNELCFHKNSKTPKQIIKYQYSDLESTYILCQLLDRVDIAVRSQIIESFTNKIVCCLFLWKIIGLLGFVP